MTTARSTRVPVGSEAGNSTEPLSLPRGNARLNQRSDGGVRSSACARVRGDAVRYSCRFVTRLIIVALGSADCRERTLATADTASAAGMVLEPPACGDDSLRPATAAPAEGLWTFERSSTERVVAMVGPTRIRAGETRVTRRVETIETQRDGRTIRQAMDTAAVHLELLPALSDSLGAGSGSRGGASPAAVYAVGSHVILASYETCAARGTAPRLRYLRRDGGGRAMVDVMLRRTSGGS